MIAIFAGEGKQPALSLERMHFNQLIYSIIPKDPEQNRPKGSHEISAHHESNSAICQLRCMW